MHAHTVWWVMYTAVDLLHLAAKVNTPAGPQIPWWAHSEGWMDPCVVQLVLRENQQEVRDTHACFPRATPLA